MVAVQTPSVARGMLNDMSESRRQPPPGDLDRP
jgi:hypothetical protein